MSKIRSFPHYEINVKDESIRYPFIPEELSLHIPLFMVLGEKGEINKPIYGSYDDQKKEFGAGTFDEYSKFFKHPSVFAKEALKYQKVFMVRLASDDAKKANSVVYLTVELADIPQWEVDVNGIRLTDGNGDWVPLMDGGTPPAQVTNPGVKLTWSLEAIPSGETFDSLTTLTTGSITKYPIYGIENKSLGASGNNTGVLFYFPNTADIDIDTIDTIDSLLFNMEIIDIPYGTNIPLPVRTKFLERGIDFSLNPDSVDPNVSRNRFFTNELEYNYNEDDLPLNIHIYAENINIINALCVSKENALHVSGDIYNISNSWLVNLFDGRRNNGSYYDTISVENIANSSLAAHTSGTDDSDALNSTTYHYLSGGDDGTISDAVLESLTQAWLTGSIFPDIQDEARYPITHLYDSGYDIDSKYSLIDFAGIRSDVKIILSTQDVNGTINDKADDVSIGTALKGSALLHPESFLYGTQACRFSIFMQCGKLIENLKYANIVPATIDCMIKKAYWHGATYIKGEPKGLPFSEVTVLKDVNWFPVTNDFKQLSWDAGLNYMQYYDMTSFHYPSTKSIYANDTSLLSDDLFVDYLIYLKHIVREEWAKYAGVSYSFAKIVGNATHSISASIYKALKDFIRTEVSIYQTDEDALLGYQSTVEIAVYDTPSNRVWKVIIPVRREEV